MQQAMDPDLANIIRQALADAEAAGKDYLSQTEEAIRTVRSFSWVRQIRLSVIMDLSVPTAT